MQEISPLRIAVIEELLALKLPDVQLAAKARQQIVIIIGRDRQRMAGNLGKLVAGGRQIAAGKGGMLQPRPLERAICVARLCEIFSARRISPCGLRTARLRTSPYGSGSVCSCSREKPNTVRKNITQLSRLSASIPSAR